MHGKGNERRTRAPIVAEAAADTGERLVIETVARHWCVDSGRLYGPARSTSVAQARMVAMYFLNVSLERSCTRIARLFGRHRTTVAHACGKVEDMRDEPRFEDEIERIEAELVRAGSARGHRHGRC